jgi:hypothetical protein
MVSGANAAPMVIDDKIKKTIPLGGALGDPVTELEPTLVFCAARDLASSPVS